MKVSIRWPDPSTAAGEQNGSQNPAGANLEMAGDRHILRIS